MQPNDFVYNQIYKGSLQKGAKETKAHEMAVRGLEPYKRHQFKKPSHLIEDFIKKAVKESKKC